VSNRANSPRVLVVDDDPSMCALLEAGLAQEGFHPASRTSGASALDAIANTDFHVILADVRMPGMTGLELTRLALLRCPDVPIVVMTADGGIDDAVAAMRVGAYDFLAKPIDLTRLCLIVDRALKFRELRSVARVRRSGDPHSGDLFGGSQAMRKVSDLLDKLADSSASVLITGETGTGKEVMSRELHRRSRRSAGPFVALNCAAVPETLLESELFGHAKGAFTDARSPRAGLFVKATGGTLLLDEIAEMPVALQPKLLRALEQRTVRPIGEAVEIPFDVRVIASTNRDLEADVEDGRFRADLFFRLNVIRVDLPPLRARGNDVLVLAEQFIEKFSAAAGKNVVGLSPGAADSLLAYAWPGNVRELKNCIERAVTLTASTHVALEDLPERVREHRASHVLVISDNPADLVTIDEMDRRYVLRVLEAVGGNRTRAAQILGLDRKTLYRHMLRYGVAEAAVGNGGASSAKRRARI
jgi:DNA-binding NtrC family response regulator